MKNIFYLIIITLFFAGCKVSNDSGKKVSFKSGNETLVGNLYYPEGYSKEKTYPAVVITGSWTTVKEQMAKNYAEEMVKLGYISLIFDFKTYGESHGEPRNLENPEEKIKDIKSAIDYLNSVQGVKEDGVHALGICASSGYLAQAAVGQKNLKGVALVAPWLHDADSVKLIYGGEKGVKEKIAKSRLAREKFEKTGEVEYVPAISTTNKEAAMFGKWDYYLNPARGAIKEWGNQFAVMAWEGWLTFDPIKSAKRITAPVVIVHSQKAALPMGAERFYKDLKVKKDIKWTTGSQFDFYDNNKKIKESVKAVNSFFLSL